MTTMSRSAGGACAPYGRAAVLLPTAAEAAAADRYAREQSGVPEPVLMENAGRAAALVLDRLYGRGRVVGVAGSGNNGGDLLVMLRTLRAWGREVAMIGAGSRPPDPALAHGWGVPALAADSPEAVDALAAGDVLVDGMLGTGSSGAPRGAIGEWIGRLNDAGRPVVALDLPSGVDATTGRVAGDAVTAAVTVTFGWPKLGLLLHPARGRCGRLIAVEIGFPADAASGVRARLITSEWARRRLPARSPDAHKGSAGRLLVLAGSSGMAGAAALTAEAAMRAGAGLLRIASAADSRVILQTLAPEATFLDRDHLDADDLEPLHALVAGPGMGQSSATVASLLRALALMPGRPALLDADALNVLAREDGALRGIADARPLVITPHAKELSRLLDTRIEEIVADPCGAARSAADSFGCVVLLKGQPSIIADPDHWLLVNTTGSSDVATAGMGDQLAGTIGGFLAGGTPPVEAAGLGLYLSGRAADLCARGVSLGPRDVTARLADALAAPGPTESPLGMPFVTFDQPPRW
jgi:ADP-dependent NAD(P)H-hydrate dehydratase / NAD(P)H-hydrate epimerase